MRTIKIGFVGYSISEFDITKANKILDDIFEEIKNKYTNRGYNVEIVTGATALGIPLLVYQHAAINEYKTIGIMCKQGYNYQLYFCDTIYAIGNDWGDESETFINYIDILYKVGGGPQSNNEADMARSKNKLVFEYELERQK